MQQNPKAVVIAGVGAMVIALLAGLIGGVALGTLLLRAVLGGLLFAALAMALQLLVRRYLPELMELSGGAPDSDVGRHVDMVVDDEVDLLTPVEEPSSEEESDSIDVEELSGDEEELVEEVSEVEEGGDNESSIPPKVPDVDLSSVDKLPDLDGFAGSFQEDGTVEVVDEDDDSVAMPGGQDAQTIAKAIQTVMKRDE